MLLSPENALILQATRASLAYFSSSARTKIDMFAFKNIAVAAEGNFLENRRS
jgi:hypothetical protein